MVKETKFVKQIKKLEKEGYTVDGGIMLFSSNKGPSALVLSSNFQGQSTIVLRAEEHLKFELDLLKAKRKLYIDAETKSPLGISPSDSAPYIN